MCSAPGRLKTHPFSAACWHSFCYVGVNKRATETGKKMLRETEGGWKAGRVGVQGSNAENPSPELETVHLPSSRRVSRREEKKKDGFQWISKVIPKQNPRPEVIWGFYISTHLCFVRPK